MTFTDLQDIIFNKLITIANEKNTNGNIIYIESWDTAERWIAELLRDRRKLNKRLGDLLEREKNAVDIRSRAAETWQYNKEGEKEWLLERVEAQIEGIRNEIVKIGEIFDDWDGCTVLEVWTEKKGGKPKFDEVISLSEINWDKLEKEYQEIKKDRKKEEEGPQGE